MIGDPETPPPSKRPTADSTSANLRWPNAGPGELSLDDRRLVLSDLVNRVLDKGLAITGSVMLAVADIDLVRLDLTLLLTAVETATRQTRGARDPADPAAD